MKYWNDPAIMTKFDQAMGVGLLGNVVTSVKPFGQISVKRMMMVRKKTSLMFITQQVLAMLRG